MPQAQEWSTAQQPPADWSAPQGFGAHPEARIGPPPSVTSRALAVLDKAFPATKPRQDDAIVSGVPVIGSIGSEDALIGGLAVRGVSRAVSGAGTGAAAKALATVKALGAEAAPQIKYEIAKNVLEYMHVPAPLAMPMAMLISGYRGNGKKAAATVEPTAMPEGFDRYAPNISGRPETPAASPAPAAGPPPSPPPAARPRNARPDQKALNEEALAVRRAAYQARMAKAPPVVEAPTEPSQSHAPKPKLSADEVKVYLDLRAKRLTDAEARDLIQASRGMTALGGTMTPQQVAAEIAARIGNRSPKR